MWCQTVRNQLSAYADGELSSAEARAVEEHLSQCDRCARERAGIHRVLRLTSLIPVEDLPSGLHSRIMGRLAYAEPKAALAPPVRAMSLWPLAWAVPAGAAALAAGILNAQPASYAPQLPVVRIRAAQPAANPEPAQGHSRTTEARPSTVVDAAVSNRPGSAAVMSTRAARAALGIATVVKDTRVQPVPIAAPGKPSTEPRATEPAPVATAAMPAEMMAMPGEPVVNAAGGGGQPETVMAVMMDKDAAMRMAGMSESEADADDDEGLRSLRMFLEERTRSIPQPPSVTRERKARKSL